jgi:K+-sensing histidine kinase KdpD
VSELPLGLLIGAALVTMVAASLLAAAMFPPPADTGRLAVLTFATVAFAAVISNPRAALAAAGIGWLVLNGFLLNQYGELHWSGWADFFRIVVLLTAAVLGSATTLAWIPTRLPHSSSSGQENQAHV